MRPDGRPSGPGQPPAFRLFFALWPAAPLVEELHRAALDGARRFGGRATTPATLHLTLAFLGDVVADRLPTLLAAVGEIHGPACEFTLDRLGFWAHNRILWAGSSNRSPQLAELAGQLCGHLRATGFLPPGNETRPFVPHITLVRKVGKPPAELPPLPPIIWSAREFVLVRSLLDERGATYQTLGRWPLT